MWQDFVEMEKWGSGSVRESVIAGDEIPGSRFEVLTAVLRKIYVFEMCDSEIDGTTISRNLASYVPDDTASHSRRLPTNQRTYLAN
jgi:hypothetical protein